MEVSNFSASYLSHRLSRIPLFYQGSKADIRNGCIQAVNCLPSDSRQQCTRNFPGLTEKRPIYFPTPKVPKQNILSSHSYLPSPCRAKSEDTEEKLSGESILLNEQSMEEELQLAIQEENYPQAAKIRDNLRLLQHDIKASVLAANARFYNSFRTGDLAALQNLWSKGEHACAVHPGVSGICGYDLVMGSWEYVWADYEFPLEIEIKDVAVHARGDIGYVTCIEMVKTRHGGWGKQFATNVFEKVDGHWYMCIHHASYIDL
ncbi:hypothetical protein DM860_002823 [Cuscuta australis]|uniref:UVR domain-containing protein n=1 Tax=Cuscuta australis TaxID=267555 RepID=A0A328D2I9_9ASTE|nr:hypothetical protein DM860_002823 [Cuscuta australis]